MRFTIKRMGVSLPGILLLVATLTAQQPPGPMAADSVADGAPITAAQIQQWIEQLDADQFMVRHTATDHLVNAGASVVEPVAQAVNGGSLEVATRGVYVLRELALCGTVSTEEAATTQLQKLAERPATSAARLAKETLAALAGVRQSRALAQLRELGATIKSQQIFAGVRQAQFLSITIDAGYHGTIEDLQRLKWLQDVQQVELSGSRFSDAWLAPLGLATGVQRLTIRHAQITDVGLQVLERLQQLQVLDLMYTPVTDGCLDSLKKATALRLVRLYGTNITTAGYDQLQVALAQAEIDFKSGAFLGVRCQQLPWPCEVIDVVAESGAKQAGVLRGDVIVRYAGQPVASFEDLRKLIAGNRVGDSVEIEIARGGQPVLARMNWQPGADASLECEDHPYGCRVLKVAEKGAAAEAGVRPGDFILEVDDQAVRTVALLKQAIAQRKDDEPVSMELVRGAKLQKLSVTFGEWKE